MTKMEIGLASGLAVLTLFIAVGTFAKKDEEKQKPVKAVVAQEKSGNVKEVKVKTKTNNAGEVKSLKVRTETGAELVIHEKTKKEPGQKPSEKHKELSDEAAEDLMEASLQEEDEQVAEELAELAEGQQEAQDEVVEAMEEVEKGNKFKALLGPDYKNLGQLRSAMVHNRNQIRKLAQLSGNTENEVTQAAIDENIQTLMAERTQMRETLVAGESTFSVLGWFFRFVNGYPDQAIDDEEEQELTEEISDVLSGEEDDEGEEGEDEEGEEGEEEEEEGETTPTE